MISVPTFSYEAYWTDFDISGEDLDFIYNLLLEREVPLTTEEMSSALVEYRLERLEKEAEEAVEIDYTIYLPVSKYEVGQRVLFPALGNLIGSVVGVRDGDNPEISEFDVIKVKFEETGLQKEFAARLEDHILNNPPEPELDEDELSSIDGVMRMYSRLIEERLIRSLEDEEDIVWIAGSWFPKALLADIHEGHLNLAEAVLDVASGGPLPTTNLLEPIEMPSGIDPLLMAFSLDYALQEDDRFDEVGPAGQVLWYLKRLEPPEVLFPPPRLEPVPTNVNRTVLTEDLIALERSLDDELSPLEPLDEVLDEVTISLLFPHWRVGALPLSHRLKSMFPTAYEAPRIRFILIDGHSGDEFPGWVVRQAGYVMGLEQWYKRYDVPPGGLVRIRRGDEKGKVIVETLDRSRRNDWIRTVTISEEGVIGFTMLKQSIGTAYDDRMVVGLIDPVTLDEAWLRGKQREMPVDRLVAQIFRELAKLTPQSAVHAQSLYSGLNVIQRLPPATVFAELVTQPYYVHVGDLYWRFESSAWSST
jgi:hypothetical protein